MRSLSKKAVWLMIFTVSAVSLAMGATITGTVKGPDGAPLMGAFVRARNTATNISTDVLSHEDGHYMVPNLPAGDYVLTIRAPGYKAAPQSETLQTADQRAKADFALEKGTVTWADISGWQGKVLFPAGPGREEAIGKCFMCHEWQHRMVPKMGLNKQGWQVWGHFMVDVANPFFLGPNGLTLSDQTIDQATTYLAQIFGPHSDLPASPADLPNYQATVRPFSPEAMNIVYVVYPVDGKWVNDRWVPDPLMMTAQTYPPTTGMGYPPGGSVWAADIGNANQVHQINPVTGRVTTYKVPVRIKNSNYPCTAEGIHAIEVGPRGDAWFAEQGCNRVGRVDPKTGKVTQYQDSYLPGKVGGIRGGSKHDAHPMLVNGKLYVFSSGSPATRLDPATGKFTPIAGVPNTYDVIWDRVTKTLFFTQIRPNVPLYEVDPSTLKVIGRFTPTINSKDFMSHRTAIDAEGNVWMTCYHSSKVCRFDVKTKTFKIYTPLGPDTSDYAIGVGKGGYIWYSMVELGTIQRLNPRTGRILEYPVPFTEQKTLRYWPDSQGRIWTASQGINAVFYFYLANSNTRAAK
ncbi:MAG TPA: carboxypeptidase regulatory-like domain-containing protein [Patescibacteria group bacterium]|nr:carboxypeptidase regulatory-like domain-containing protein [Patescibacteria group bacterium]